MEKFGFSSQSQSIQTEKTLFSGHMFYQVYKEAEFLRHNENIDTVLMKSHELRHKLKCVTPGNMVLIDGMHLEKNTPLLVKKTGPNVSVESFEFTANRLTGLVAAYAFENRHRLPSLKSSEAESLGLKWVNCDIEICKLYLAAVSGTEHFYDQFSFYPLICGLRKLQIKKITLEPIVKMARIKSTDGVRMATNVINNIETVNRLWAHFPGTSNNRFNNLVETAPKQLLDLFKYP